MLSPVTVFLKSTELGRVPNLDFEKEEVGLETVKDLPKKDLAVDVDNNFEPRYEVIEGKKKLIQELKAVAERLCQGAYRLSGVTLTMTRSTRRPKYLKEHSSSLAVWDRLARNMDNLRLLPYGRP